MAEKAILSWSGGKDSTMALHETLRGGEYDVAALLTTVTREYDRISIHGVRSELLARQAAALGIPLQKVYIPKRCSNEEYESAMRGALASFAEAGIHTVISGDIYLEDVRAYRERLLEGVGMRGAFPLWGRDTQELAHGFLTSGYRALTSCVDSHSLDATFAGRCFDERFLADLPEGADPCGENGEFHTFVFDGPALAERVPCVAGEVTLRDGRFYYCDLLPG